MFQELKQFVKDIFEALGNFVDAVFLRLLEWLLDGIAYIIESISPPEFLSQYSLQDTIPDSIVWFLQQSQFGTCLAIISAAYIFRIIRRFVTLGIW